MVPQWTRGQVFRMGLVDHDATSKVYEAASFARLIGYEVLELGEETVQARVAWNPERLTTGSGLHGGVLMSLADICGGVIAFLNLPAGSGGTSTIESKTNFFRPLKEGHAIATARVLHRGRTTLVVETDIQDEDGQLVSKTIQTEAVLYESNSSPGESSTA